MVKEQSHAVDGKNGLQYYTPADNAGQREPQHRDNGRLEIGEDEIFDQVFTAYVACFGKEDVVAFENLKRERANILHQRTKPHEHHHENGQHQMPRHIEIVGQTFFRLDGVKSRYRKELQLDAKKDDEQKRQIE